MSFEKRLLKKFKNILFQNIAIIEKNLASSLRFKFNLILSFISPIISIILPMIIMGKFYSYNVEFGPWTATNYLVYQYIAVKLGLIRGLIGRFPNEFRQEKYWETLPAMMIAPFNRFNLLIAIFMTHIILDSIPFAFIFILCYMYYQISLFTIIFLIFLYFLICLIYSGLGLIIGIFAISKENYFAIFNFAFNIFFIFSCITFPYEIFPSMIQSVVNLNPLYYIFDFLRLSWIENDFLYSISSHSFDFFIILFGAISLPVISIQIFNITYKKYGIVGY